MMVSIILERFLVYLVFNTLLSHSFSYLNLPVHSVQAGYPKNHMFFRSGRRNPSTVSSSAFLGLVASPSKLTTNHLLQRFASGSRRERKKLYSMDGNDHTSESTIVKRKFAMVCSYLGSNYKGIQYTSPDVPTIELELMNAMRKVGCILDSNYGDLKKISWSRSSRTDKGVHCARMIITAKFEVDNNAVISSSEGRMPQLVRDLNNALPEDIRIMSIVKINQGFAAKTACHWREYEYLLPVRCFNETMTMTQHIDRLNRSLKKYEGTHSFHNFHRLGTKDLSAPKPKMMPRWQKDGLAEGDFLTSKTSPGEGNHKIGNIGINEEQGEEQEEEEEEEGEEGDEAEVAPKEKGMSQGSGSVDLNLMRNFDLKSLETLYKETIEGGGDGDPSQVQELLGEWPFTQRLIAPKTTSSIYFCEAHPEVITIDGESFVKIVVIGKFFLLHQIRLMVGAALVESLGLIPSFSIDFALAAPVQVVFPMAPAEGLVLVNAGISHTEKANHEYKIFSRFVRGYCGEFPLLTDEEYRISEEFKAKKVYPRMKLDWEKMAPFYPRNGIVSYEPELMTVCDGWIKKIRGINVPLSVEKAWGKLFDVSQQTAEEFQNSREEKELDRRKRLILDFQRQFILPPNPEAVAVTESVDNKKSHRGDARNMGNKKATNKDPKKKPFPHKVFLPNNLCTELSTRFRVTPDKAINDVLNNLASAIAAGKIPGESTTSELLDIVDKSGGIQAVAKWPKHPMIV